MEICFILLIFILLFKNILKVRHYSSAFPQAFVVSMKYLHFNNCIMWIVWSNNKMVVILTIWIYSITKRKAVTVGQVIVKGRLDTIVELHLYAYHRRPSINDYNNLCKWPSKFQSWFSFSFNEFILPKFCNPRLIHYIS